MRSGQSTGKIGAGGLLLALSAGLFFDWSVVAAQSQTALGTVGAARRPLDRVVRSVDDPHTGVRWLLVTDNRHPGGPGRMVPASEESEVADSQSSIADLPENSKAAFVVGTSSTQTSTKALASAKPPVPSVIRIGDRLIVEEHTAIADVRLEAVALGSATVGAAFNVRLVIGGRVTQVIAMGPGDAAFELEARP